MKKITAKYIVTVLFLLMTACLSSCSLKQQKTELKGYDTPEKAVTEYLNGLKKMDLEQMINTFVIDTYVDKYDFEDSINRMEIYTGLSEIKFPNATTLARDLNAESRRANISSSILRQYVKLSSPDFSFYESQILKTKEEQKKFTDEFTQKLQEVKTDSIKILGFIPPEKLSEEYGTDTNMERMKRLTKICGADEMASRAAVFELGGKAYFMCVDTANYGGKWYLAELGGNLGILLGAELYSGGLIPLSGEDLDMDWEEWIIPAS